MKKFSIGDLVECVVEHAQMNKNLVIGSLGTVVEVSPFPPHIGVRWECGSSSKAKYYCDKYGLREDLHDCNGNCDNGYGWYVEESDIDHVVNDAPMEDIDFHDLLGLLK